MEMTCEEFFEVYREDMLPRLREHTWTSKEYMIKSKLLPHFGKMRMSEIQSIDIVRWQNALMSPTRNDGNAYSPTYLRTVNNQLTAILNHTARYYGLHPNPAVRTVKMGGKEAKEMTFWTKDKYLKFADVVMEKPAMFAMFEVLYWTGIRVRELLALTPEDFDFENRTMRINKSYQRLKGHDVIADPKTSKSVRVVKLPKFLAEEVEDYMRNNWRGKPGTRLFPASKQGLAREIERGSARVGVKRIRVYDLRHSNVSLLVDMGFTALAIADRMGHESADITFRYAHLFPNVQQNMADALDHGRDAF